MPYRRAGDVITESYLLGMCSANRGVIVEIVQHGDVMQAHPQGVQSVFPADSIELRVPLLALVQKASIC